MPTTGEISLYVHIPFCTKKCPYCHFYVIPNRSFHRELYLQSLQQEWRLRLPLLKGKTLASLYFGGGTPSLFPEVVEHLFSWLDEASLSRTETFECTFEVNPEDVTEELIERVKKRGVNRISMGVQSFSEPSLHLIGRSHGAEKALQAVDLIKKAGIENLSIDLMYDLPKQTVEDFRSSLEKIPHLPVTHLSLYNLQIEPHTVFHKRRKELEPQLPSQEESTAMLEEAVQFLTSHGFQRYEISAFAKENLFSRHNMGYWTGRPFLGFGPSACSYWEGRRFRNTSHLLRYAKALEEGKDPADFSECLDVENRQKELFCVGLRLLDGISLFPFQEKYGPLSASLQKSLQTLTNEGFLFEREGKIALSEKGLLFHDTVAEKVFADCI